MPVSIVRFTILEDVNDSDIPMQAVAATMAGEYQPEVPALSADGQICAAEGMADAGREVLPPASEQSVGAMDPKAPGWIKRVRIGVAALGRTPCPSRASALEKANRGYAENTGDNVIEPKMGSTKQEVDVLLHRRNRHSAGGSYAAPLEASLIVQQEEATIPLTQ